jgi:hypothetical protein
VSTIRDAGAARGAPGELPQCLERVRVRTMSDVDDDFDVSGDDEFEPAPPVPEARKVVDPAATAARSLAIRRAIETRIEQKRMEADLDYLELDSDKD